MPWSWAVCATGFPPAVWSNWSGSTPSSTPAFTHVGFPMVDAVHAEQPHGNRAQAVFTPRSVLGVRVPEVDALVTAVPRMPLVVRVADCGPVFFYDPIQRVIAVAHLGPQGDGGQYRGRDDRLYEGDVRFAPGEPNRASSGRASARRTTRSTLRRRSSGRRRPRVCGTITIAGSARPRTSTATTPIARRRARRGGCGASSCSNRRIFLATYQNGLL